MNVALLNDYEIDIERVGLELEEQGYKRYEVIEQLNKRYRVASKKGDFRCVCCDERVDMVLPDDKVFFFRHYDKETCSYSENHKTYKSQKSLEDMPKHRAGKAILRTYLEGTCKVNKIRLTDGYRFKSTLSYVPDFILEFPSGQKWAVDYLTGLKTDQKYANSLHKRRNTYIQHHFTPIFLFDSYWLAYEPDINHVSLVDGELLCVGQTQQDYLWTDFIRRLDTKLKDTLFIQRPFNLQVKSMAYFAPYEREINIIRFLQQSDNPRKTRTVYHPINVPLDKALTINHDQSDFTYTNDTEEEYRQELKRQLELIHQQQEHLRKQQELERAKQEEEARKQRELARTLEEERKKRTAQNSSYDSTPPVPFIGRTQQQMDVDMKRDMEFLQRSKLSEESYLYKQVVQNLVKYYGIEGEVGQVASEHRSPVNLLENSQAAFENNQSMNGKNNLASKLPNWKVDEILNHYVNGEAYFLGDQRKWKEIVLHSYELVNHNKISIPQLLEKIKEQGIKYQQPEKIMSYPIKEYLQFISKRVKNGGSL
ncbi:hypothetical protein [Neobacillus cucumis]|uniref:Competence protein n=1 Tax=Neobacillus cucumis TaxID=1740721 RepID=A0A2N5H9Z6_9BACI|nr:hypothetical protein [Neobacillus cucumis]PLS02324.1 hypothetical protein CVD27_20300 [Neobacillus cucumis]